MPDADVHITTVGQMAILTGRWLRRTSGVRNAIGSVRAQPWRRHDQGRRGVQNLRRQPAESRDAIASHAEGPDRRNQPNRSEIDGHQFALVGFDQRVQVRNRSGANSTTGPGSSPSELSARSPAARRSGPRRNSSASISPARSTLLRTMDWSASLPSQISRLFRARPLASLQAASFRSRSVRRWAQPRSSTSNMAWALRSRRSCSRTAAFRCVFDRKSAN